MLMAFLLSMSQVSFAQNKTTKDINVEKNDDDIKVTVTEEKITHDAGTWAPEELTVDDLHQLIEEAGFEPVQRTTTYEEVAAQV